MSGAPVGVHNPVCPDTNRLSSINGIKSAIDFSSSRGRSNIVICDSYPSMNNCLQQQNIGEYDYDPENTFKDLHSVCEDNIFSVQYRIEDIEGSTAEISKILEFLNNIELNIMAAAGPGHVPAGTATFEPPSNPFVFHILLGRSLSSFGASPSGYTCPSHKGTCKHHQADGRDGEDLSPLPTLTAALMPFDLSLTDLFSISFFNEIVAKKDGKKILKNTLVMYPAIRSTYASLKMMSFRMSGIQKIIHFDFVKMILKNIFWTLSALIILAILIFIDLGDKMYMTESEFEEYKKEYPDEEYPEYDSLEWKIMFLPCEQYDEHQKRIFRLIDVSIVQSFLESIKGRHYFTPEEEHALDLLYKTFNSSDNESWEKLGLN
jgi:hypothetical protein